MEGDPRGIGLGYTLSPRNVPCGSEGYSEIKTTELRFHCNRFYGGFNLSYHFGRKRRCFMRPLSMFASQPHDLVLCLCPDQERTATLRVYIQTPELFIVLLCHNDLLLLESKS